MTGTLYVVATPIGNLEDVTLRALRILREVDLIACEDTRHTAKLLAYHQIQKPTTSYHEHNEMQKAASLLKELESGKQIALVTDAGTPCISDPGYRIVRLARANHIAVSPVPGPCSFVAALSVAGKPTSAFTFLGFLPFRKTARLKLLESVVHEHRTLIFFETPERLLESLKDVSRIFGERDLTVARELTKVYEELFSGCADDCLRHFSQKVVRGEIVLIIEPRVEENLEAESLDLTSVRDQFAELTVNQQMPLNEAVKKLAKELNVSKRELYKRLIPGSGPNAADEDPIHSSG